MGRGRRMAPEGSLLALFITLFKPLNAPGRIDIFLFTVRNIALGRSAGPTAEKYGPRNFLPKRIVDIVIAARATNGLVS